MYIQIADEIAGDRKCSFKPSEYLGFSPVFLPDDALARTASAVFEITTQRTSNNLFLARTFLIDGRLLAGASLFSTREAASRATYMALPAEEFAKKSRIHIERLATTT
jgi:hypothetical protein